MNQRVIVKTCEALLWAGLIFGLLNFVYVVGIQFALGYWILTDKLSHWTPWLRVDVFGMLSYLVALASFIILVYWGKLLRSEVAK